MATEREQPWALETGEYWNQHKLELGTLALAKAAKGGACALRFRNKLFRGNVKTFLGYSSAGRA